MKKSPRITGRRLLWLAILLLPAAVRGPAAEVQIENLLDEPVEVEFFFDPGCEICARVRAEVLPELEERCYGLYRLQEYDIGIDSNYLRLSVYMEKLDLKENATAFFIVGGRHSFVDWNQIATGLVDGVEERIAERLAGDEPLTPLAVTEEDAGGTLNRRFEDFTLVGIVLAALVDGVNPCAISTLVFFISMLAVFKVRAHRLILAGVSFCAASFITYLAIGFGLLRFLHLFSGTRVLRGLLEGVMVAALLVMAWLSFRDAVRFRASGDSGDVTLQLPRRIKDRMHGIIRRNLGSPRLVTGAFAIGVAVTALESVCTGQVYLPTLVMLIEQRRSMASATGYLLLYNVLFILPLVVAFGLAYAGVSVEQFVKWSRRNVVPSKIALGLFFLAMAVLLVVL